MAHIVDSAARDPWETDYRKIWRAAYGAAFALMAFDHMVRLWRGAPEPKDFDAFHEEATAWAVEAAERGSRIGVGS